MNGEVKCLTVAEAARLMGKSKQFIRIGLQRGAFPFGSAVKTSSKWSYYINAERFEKWMTGEDLAQRSPQSQGGAVVKYRKLAMLIVLLNVVLTPLAIREAYLWRGYWAVGGEWLILPASVYIAWLFRLKREVKAG